jgi:hypothetical protein
MPGTEYGSTPTANVKVCSPRSTGRSSGVGASAARIVSRYTPGSVNAQLMCVCASGGRVAVSSRYPSAGSNPSVEST